MNHLTDLIAEDWETVKQRYEHWWHNELYDRALIQVTAPRQGAQPAAWPNGPVTPAMRWTDIEYIVWQQLERCRCTFFGGEALPNITLGMSVGHALLMGCQYRFAMETVWAYPLPVGGDGFPPLRLERDGAWWRWLMESTATLAQRSHGRYFVNPLFGNHAADTLAVIRDFQTLMMDIALHPAWVRDSNRQVSDFLIEVFAALWPLVGPDVTGLEGSVNYCEAWSPARTLGFDCDISCMVSPRVFQEMFLPSLIETMRTVEHRFYHLDGPGALQHLDALLAVPEIQAIQWVPGYGHEDVRQWLPLIRRIQQAGKSVQLSVPAPQVGLLLQEAPSKGLLIRTHCASEEEARALVRMASRSVR